MISKSRWSNLIQLSLYIALPNVEFSSLETDGIPLDLRATWRNICDKEALSEDDLNIIKEVLEQADRWWGRFSRGEELISYVAEGKVDFPGERAQAGLKRLAGLE
jgi:AAA+ ATPase superfamily predicted ATPase